MSHVFRRLQRQVTHEPPRWSPPSCGGFQPSSIHGSFPPRTVASVASRHYSTRSRFNKADQRSLGTREIEGTFQQRQWKRSVHLQQSDKQRINQGSQQIKSVTNGRILTTPTRLLKLILWLPNENSKDRDTTSKKNASDRSTSVNEANQPLALLVHPQQPLSYIERLVQAEIPPILKDGKEITPSVRFRAVGDNTNASGKPETSDTDEQALSHPDDLSHVASYSGLGHEGPERDKADTNWVRWSNSTEIGDFIRDAARGTEFVIEIEGHDGEMRVSVPSFNDRTFYMRSRLRKMSRQIDELSHIKRECDLLAYRGANRLAKGGFALLTGWWCVVYYVTFHTEFGWDLVEPVTYLAGLTTIMGGYLWFLYISKDLSYKAAMNVTVSRRQNALYEARGFEPEKWEHLVQEANALRREIRAIAVEYDVDWDESMDVGDEVKEVLDQERNTKDGTLPAEKQKTEPGGAERRKKDEASDADES